MPCNVGRLHNIKQQFQLTCHEAEHSFVSQLQEHYRLTRNKLLEQLTDIEETVSQALPNATQAEQADHNARMEAMRSNIEKEKAALKATKEKKTGTGSPTTTRKGPHPEEARPASEAWPPSPRTNCRPRPPPLTREDMVSALREALWQPPPTRTGVGLPRRQPPAAGGARASGPPPF